MIPDRIPSGSSVGEKAIFEILQNLPEDCLVYYEPIVARKFPDFIVISPRVGILIIEVKGWYPKNIVGGDLNDINLQIRNRSETSKHPMRQARDYMYSLMDEARNILNAPALLNNNKGEHEGKFLFPFGNMVVLNNIEKEQLYDHDNGDLTIIFPDSKTVYKNELNDLILLDSDELELKLKSFFDPWWKFRELDETQVNLIRAIIHPEIKVSANKPPVKKATNNEQKITDLKVFDLAQEQMAHSIGDGHRLIRGVAGSGKTIVLIARAKLLSEREDKPEILVLCYNVSLSFYLKIILANHTNITVLHFDGWAKQLGCTRQFTNGESESNESLGNRLLARLQHGCEDSEKYKAILVDEAQDFAPSWFKCILEALTDRDNDDLLIVGDDNQKVFGGGKFPSWKSLGINVIGKDKSKKLEINYRNTKKILEVADLFSNHKSLNQDDDSGIQIVPVDVSKSKREGDFRPVFIECHSRKEEINSVVNQIKDLLQHQTWQGSKIPAIVPNNIGILYRHSTSKDKPLINDLIGQLNQFTQAVWLNEYSDARTMVNEPGVKIQTIYSAKGLQYAAVFVIWADLLPAPFPDTDEEQERNLLYVALTRPEEYLMITASGKSSFTKIIDNHLNGGDYAPNYAAGRKYFDDFDDDIPF